jgi:hypothetical protein
MPNRQQLVDLEIEEAKEENTLYGLNEEEYQGHHNYIEKWFQIIITSKTNIFFRYSSYHIFRNNFSFMFMYTLHFIFKIWAWMYSYACYTDGYTKSIPTLEGYILLFFK